jgi:hypothetical protein
VFWDESGASLLPVTRRTWAPRGHTPVIRHRFNWKRVSMAAALCYGSLGGGAAVGFHHQLDAYNTDTLIQALGELRRFLGGQRRPCCGTGYPPTAAWPCGPGPAASVPGWSRNHCPEEAKLFS